MIPEYHSVLHTTQVLLFISGQSPLLYRLYIIRGGLRDHVSYGDIYKYISCTLCLGGVHNAPSTCMI